MSNILSIYGSHDASVTFLDSNNQLKVLEYERFVRNRYAMFSERFDDRALGSNDKDRRKFLSYIKSQINYEVDKIVYNELSDLDKELIIEYFPKAKFELCGHHLAHAASGYYLSEFDEALILSIDGGGQDYNDVFFTRIYKGNESVIIPLDSPDVNLGGAYGKIGSPISEIKPGPDSNTDSLVYAGKVMGLCAYGNIRTEWIEFMVNFYDSKAQSLTALGNVTGLDLSFNSLKGQLSYDLAATSQFIFEQFVLEILKPYIDEYDNFILVGGCALNVLFNQRFKKLLDEKNKNLYVPSNPNDCGLSLGQYLIHNPNVDVNVYSGFDILDRDKFEYYKDKYQAHKIDTQEIVDLLKEGKIIGLVEGCSEIGPRALGNRSIICDPSFPNMKDTLNAKVKFREWFRPFAPVCRLEDKDNFFDDAYESEFMSYAPKVKEQYKQQLKTITHEDGTARLQTVTKDQHSTFYNILSELDKSDEIPVILNTSFNIKGRPILTTIEDAIYVLENTELDYLIVENYLFTK